MAVPAQPLTQRATTFSPARDVVAWSLLLQFPSPGANEESPSPSTEAVGGLLSEGWVVSTATWELEALAAREGEPRPSAEPETGVDAAQAEILSGTADVVTLKESLVRESASTAFERLFRADESRRADLADSLTQLPAQVVLEAGLASYRERGNSDRLDLTAELLGRMGQRSVPALVWISRTIDEDVQSAFVSLVAHAGFLRPEERLGILARLAASRDYETRCRVLGVVHYLEHEVQVAVLQVLVNDRDAELATEARALYETLRPSTDA